MRHISILFVKPTHVDGMSVLSRVSGKGFTNLVTTCVRSPVWRSCWL